MSPTSIYNGVFRAKAMTGGSAVMECAAKNALPTRGQKK
jgi:hypothetical protein